jgi:hypothetical protein
MAEDPRSPFDFYVDVFGFCNLRCPSCPVGNLDDIGGHFTKGLMSPMLLDAILAKANRECRVGSISLFNWSEPVLHPALPALIRLVRAYGNRAELSANLNRLTDPDALMAALPHVFRVSISGFRQEIYARAHRRGNIEAVKRNMERLAAARDRIGADVALQVLFHRYRYNGEDEAPARAFSEALGFEFMATWAMHQPVEKILALLGDPAATIAPAADDHEVVSTLSIDLHQALAWARASAPNDCRLLERQIVIDVVGDVFLCCGTTNSTHNRIGAYLDLGITEIQARRHARTLCRACMGHGVHHYLQNQADFSALAET